MISKTQVKSLLRRSLQDVTAATLGPLESYLVSRAGQPESPPIFIVGQARSGTTLIYQAIAYTFDVSFLSNFITGFPITPAIVAKLASYAHGCSPPKLFNSIYGQTKGWRSPAQGYQVWNRWFPRNGVGTRKISWTDKNRKSFAGTISFIEKSFDAPFISKWPGFSTNILSIVDAVPASLFIRVKRDYLQNAQSILKGRYDLTGNPNISISRVADSYNAYAHRPYTDQVIAYLFGIEQQLNRDSEIIGKNRVLTVKYEDFCLDSVARLKEIQEWYKVMTSCELRIRHDDIPASFALSQSQKTSSEEKLALKDCLEKMSSEFDVDR